MKRIFDIAFSLIAIIVFSIPMTVIAIALRSIERHPVFFRQERMGKDMVPFTILKFQTMVDNQVTPIGAVIRKSGLDELAQFFNVLKGDMSIVGPRALTMYDIERLGWNDEYHRSRWSVNPGISGFAQIFGGQHRKLSWFWDKKYINEKSIVTDFAVVAISFAMNIFGKTKVRRIVFNNKELK